jgi:hypothetical protein
LDGGAREYADKTLFHSVLKTLPMPATGKILKKMPKAEADEG